MAIYIGTSTTEPVIGELKVGDKNVEKIYQGSTLVWPSNTPPSRICDYKFQDRAELNVAVDLWTGTPAQKEQAKNYYGHISNWCFADTLTDMSSLFHYKFDFNDDISGWDVSNVTSMLSMFGYARAFNGDLSYWDVGNVTVMNGMFRNTDNFNKNIGNWNVSSVEYMHYMFDEADAFNQDLSSWCVTNINTEPYWFSRNSPLTEENKPNWGAPCPQ